MSFDYICIQDGRVNALYSTPSIYTDAKYAETNTWPLKKDDYFPYASDINAYWTGYFTSRPALKGYVGMLSSYYLVSDTSFLLFFVLVF
ncbi:putative alpha-mannosidase [Helianthus anomalus]